MTERKVKRGLEELDDMRPLGDYLQRFPNGRCILLRGKFKGAYVDTVPTGYLEKFVLEKWDLTEAERDIIEELVEEHHNEGLQETI